MSCLAPEQIAAAASGQDADALAHVEECAVCRSIVEEQRRIRELAAALMTPPLARAHREALAAETLARADELPIRRRSRRRLVAIAAALAAAIALVALGVRQRFVGSGDEVADVRATDGNPSGEQAATGRGQDGRGPDGRGADGRTTDDRGSDERFADGRGTDGRSTNGRGTDGRGTDGRSTDGRGTDGRSTDGRSTDGRGTDGRSTDGRVADGRGSDGRVADGRGTDGSGTDGADRLSDHRTVVRAQPAAVIASTSPAPAQFTRAHGQGRELIDLSEGAITIETRSQVPVEIAAPRAVGTSGPARAGVRVVKGRVAVAAKHGVISSVTVFAGSAEVVSGGKTYVIEAGAVWESARDGAIGEASADAAALAAFRDGWTALREQRYAEAIAAFDRATDPVVAEDAGFWAAVAAERAGDRPAARTRLAAFIAAFPQSPRIEAARAAAEKLAAE